MTVQNLTRCFRLNSWKYGKAAGIFVVSGAAGLLLLQLSSAASYVNDLEAEVGVVAGNAEKLVGQDGASNEGTVIFGPVLPTPVPTPPSPSPPPSSKPGASNTGPRNQDGTIMSAAERTTKLNPVSSSQIISEINAGKRLIENVRISGMVSLQVSNVTFRNFTLDAGGGTYGFKLTTGSPTGTVIEDGEIVNFASASVAGANYRVTRVNVHESDGDAFKLLGSNITIENSWWHRLGRGEGAHADGMQSQGTGYQNIIVRGNNCDMPVNEKGGPGTPYKSNACYIQTGSTDIRMIVENNWLNGGNYTINNCAGKDLVFRNNKFGRDYRYGLKSVGTCTWTGNVWEDTGAPAP